MKKFANFGQISWIIAHGPRPKNAKLWPQRNVGLKRYLKGLFLSFQKINVIGPTELKLWPFDLALALHTYIDGAPNWYL